MSIWVTREKLALREEYDELLKKFKLWKSQIDVRVG